VSKKAKTNAARRREANRLGGNIQSRIEKRFRDFLGEVVDTASAVMLDDIEELEADAEERVEKVVEEANKRIRDTNERNAEKVQELRGLIREHEGAVKDALNSVADEVNKNDALRHRLSTAEAEIQRLRQTLKIVRSQVTAEGP
jgi:uncharacterized protein YjbJ (UPF0337 family)